ncbi:ParB/Srx family N-terminal domain-containing protein [Psychrobacter pygoscelis]|uniref:ParB/Srx family N-terminal domain-containing protein n=1 Tax=Psychrobacter pygoscelis TaxID=2488563 RepID=UPI00103AA612|nr:ParB/Srx family N-terminal domain-containing protein [Psychrobacter pygoscelis]
MTDKTPEGELEIKYRKTSELIPYVNNSRTHNDEQVNQIAASIKEFGFTNPVLIDETGGIIAGHGRLMAANKLNMDAVPTITLAGLTEAQRKAYVIADNKIALNADWDIELLKIEIDNLRDLDFDIELIGFDEDDLLDLFDKNEIDEDSVLIEHDEVSDSEKFLLLVEYDNESQLEKAFNEAQQKGFKCKIIE